MARREGHYMPASLLDSQLATLEPLEEDEAGVIVDIAAELGEAVLEDPGHRVDGRLFSVGRDAEVHGPLAERGAGGGDGR